MMSIGTGAETECGNNPPLGGWTQSGIPASRGDLRHEAGRLGVAGRPELRARGGRRGSRPMLLVVALAALLGGGLTALAQTQGILREVWQGIAGGTVADLTNSPAFPDSPTSTNLVADFFEAPVNAMDNYGQRMHGYLAPPVSGDYTFWIASDDGGELWLSTDESPANRRLIAWVASWTDSRQWTKEANQQSAPVRLQAGQYYYVAALQKEGGGGDNLAVRWLRPDGADEGPIPARYLWPYGIALSPPVISQQPTNTSVMEGQTAVFRVQLSNPQMVHYQWQRNETNLPGATAQVLEYGPARLTDHLARFRVVATNSQGSVTSAVAVLSVTPDTVPPALVQARNEGLTTVRVSFSEPMAAPAATNPANYRLDGGYAVLAAAYGQDQATVLLTTAPLVYGQTLTLTVNQLTDQAATPNPLPPNSQVRFTVYEYVPQDIGGPLMPGTTVSVPGGADVTGGGATIGGTSDQFQFGWQDRTGDFDLAGRVAGVTVSDPFVRAGLMARESLAANGRFAAAFASSVQLGCFFQSRTNVGSAATVAAPRGGYPVNYPHTWLRLRRSGNTLTGFASQDGEMWTQLGSVTLSGLSNRLYVGLAVCSDTTNATATARFRDLGPPPGTAIGAARRDHEPVGPSSRTTGMIFSELMYHPAPRADSRNLEFVEVHNARSVFEDLTGWRVSGDIEYEFPAGFRLQAGETVVLAAVPEDIRAVYGITNVLGPYTGALPNDAGRVQLLNNAGAIRLEVNYSDQPPWPVAADGAGHSLVLARPSYGEGDPRAWAASRVRGGSPGEMDPVLPSAQAGVCINEFLAHTDDPQPDYVELYNHSNARVDLSGCILTDDPWTNRFRVPDGTFIEARGFVVFDQYRLGFALNAAGETLYLINPEGTRVLDAVRYGGQENGVATGRWPDGAPTFRRLAWLTPGTTNAPWRVEDAVINELMYHPLSGDSDDEYVELHNRSGNTVDLSGWRFVDGIDFTLPGGSVVPPGGYLVVARNADRLRANYPQLNVTNTVGNYSGSLADRGERVALAKPDWIVTTNASGVVETNRITIVVSEVTYADGGRWGVYADGGGSSLELIDPRSDLLRPSNWAASDETAKATWTTVAVTGRVDNANTGVVANRLRIGLLGRGECLVDDVEVLRLGQSNVVNNGGFEGGATNWSFHGNHSASTVVSTGAVSGSRCLHVRAQGDCDTGPNAIRTALTTALTTGSTNVIRARVRWLAGWPQVLFRIHGNGLELAADLAVPTPLGTPGLPNSRRVANAGPAIYDVSHSPPLPAANEPVLVTCRVSDPDGVSLVRLRYRVDPSSTLSTVTMRDDGTQGDEIAGDGLYTATLTGRAAGSLVAFRITATDNATPTASSTFPAAAPAEECLVRWGDEVPFGTFAHYHLWFTQATGSARTNALDNTYRDCTLVYGNHRVIYNTGFRDKGSPYHHGGGDIAATTPRDEPLLGTFDRVFASTGNGGSEATGIRSQLAAWYAQQLGIPYLHAHYMRLYFNGSLFRPDIMEDLEQPNHDYAERWFPAADEGDLYKVAVWFEFDDNNSGFKATGATLQRFTGADGGYKLARYRWNWQRRSNDNDANRYDQFFNLVTAMNNTAADYADGALNLADMEQWMRVFCYDFAMGNWDVWTYNVGQNMFLYRPVGCRWVLMPWDIDFVFGLGHDYNGPLRGSSQDATMSRAYNHPTFQRMNWRAYWDTVNGPFLPEKFQPQIDARKSVLTKNNVPGLTSPAVITSWINSRRNYLVSQINAFNAPVFNITSNNGADFTNTTPTVLLTGNAPFPVATIEVNGVPYPVTWVTVRSFRINVPLTQVTNALTLVGKDRRGNPVPGAQASITVIYPGAVPRVEDNVVISEVHYDPPPTEPNSSFIELHNRSATTPFDLSGFRLQGLSYTLPPGSVMPAGAYWVLVADRVGFEAVFGTSVPVFDVYPGGLDNDGERLALIKPGDTPGTDLLVSDVRYWPRLPWPTNAANLGASLQLIDRAQGAWRVGNWAAPATNSPNRATPGRTNAVAQTLDPFPPVWINEVQPFNVSGPQDGAGERDPWLELYNAGTNTVDLSSFYLTPTYTNLTLWPFPTGTTIEPGGFLVVWADGEPGEVRPGELHTSFRLAPNSGAVAFCRLQGTPPTPAVMDYLEYDQLGADRSFGSYPDGEPRQRRPFVRVTPAAGNDPEMPPVTVLFNEFMAGNTRTVADPADGDFDDWFELFNAGTNTVDLSSYTLTDDLENPTKYRIPAGTVIPAGGFLLVWADEETGQNAPGRDLHVNFKLALGGEALGLFAPDGSLVDGLTFGPQTNDVSMGRYPDGAPLPVYSLTTPSPRAPNILEGGNRPPTIAPIAHQSVAEGSLLAFAVQATDPDAGQTLQFSLGDDAPAAAQLDEQTGQFRWTPDEADGPGVFQFTIRATDNGSPPRSATALVQVQVGEVNQPPVLEPVADQFVDEGQLLVLELTAADPDLPPNDLVFALDPGAPEGMSITPEGRLTWQPDETLGGRSFPITVRVSDQGTPPCSHARTFTVTVAESASPPVVPLISPQSVDEGQVFRLTVEAFDPDTPPSPLVFSLESAPAGAGIDPQTGQITWSTTEADGPTNAIFVVRVAKANAPHLATSRTFGVLVNEINQPPRLAPLPPQTVREGQTLAVCALANDPDLPPQALRFSLASPPPPGLDLDPVSGWILWDVDSDFGATNLAVAVAVSDDGPGMLSATQTLHITVLPRSHLVINEILYRPIQPGTEFVELFNTSAHTSEELDGVTLSGDALAFSFPPGARLAPGQFVLVVGNRTAFTAAYGSGLPIAGEWTGALGVGGDILQLTRNRPGQPVELLDEVRYDAGAPWPAAANGGGASLQLLDPNQDNSRVANWQAVPPTVAGQPRLLVVLTNLWRYNQLGQDLGSDWRQPAYNDAAWPTGRALLYVETADLAAPKNTPLTIGRMTYYFRTKFNYTGPTLGVRLKARLFVDDAAVVYLNGHELLRLGFNPETLVHFDTPAERLVGDAAEEGALLLEADGLRYGENTLAAEVHQNNLNSSDIVWGMELEVESVAEPATPGRTNSVATPLPPFPPLWLNEVLTLNTTGLLDNAGEREPWIELFNTGLWPVTVEGWYLTDSLADLTRWAFPPGFAIAGQQFRLLWADGQPSQSSVEDVHTGFRLLNLRTLALVRDQPGGPAVVDYLGLPELTPDSAVGACPDGQGFSRCLLASPTPAAPNSPPAPPRLSAAQRTADGHLVLAWTAVPGQRYRIETTLALDGAPWQPVADMVAQQPEITVTLPTEGQMRFFRVVVP